MIGNVLKEKRKSLDLSQEEMAEKLGVSRRYYIRIESNEELPSLSRLIDMSKSLNIPIDKMVSSEPEELLEEPEKDFEIKCGHKYLSHKKGKTVCSAKCCVWRDHNGVCPGEGCMKEWQEQQRIKRLMKARSK